VHERQDGFTLGRVGEGTVFQQPHKYLRKSFVSSAFRVQVWGLGFRFQALGLGLNFWEHVDIFANLSCPPPSGFRWRV
jgi:hypothetical protein